jgi:hypothetical protein
LPVGERWTVLRNVAGEIILRGPGLSASDQIFVGAHAFYNSSADYYNWWLSGFTGYESANSFETQPGAHHVGSGAGQSGPILNLWNSPIPYWFIINGRRILVVAKISTVYVSAYLGLLEAPYASPGQWPYPLMIGGSSAWKGSITLTSTQLRWSYTGDENRNWFNPRPGVGYSNARDYQMRIRLGSGTWWGFSSDSDHGYPGNLYPVSNGADDMRACLDGSYPRYPLIPSMLDTDGSVNVLGEIQTVTWVPGFANASEVILTDGAVNWLVFQNVYRTTKKDYCAFKLA